jgi:GNAT superfamily N-acetyltransferase
MFFEAMEIAPLRTHMVGCEFKKTWYIYLFRGKKVEIRIRNAESEDILRLQELIVASVKELQADDYSEAQMAGALESVFGVDSRLIADATYFVAEVRENSGAWEIAGCGGWSKRKTLFGGDAWTGREDNLLDPRKDAAKIRAFFVHPAWARRGVGTRILEACEKAARAAGFTRYEMGATLTGRKLFGARGYMEIERIEVPLKNGVKLPVIRMEKRAGGGSGDETS